MRTLRTLSMLAPLAVGAVATAQQQAPPTPQFTPGTNPVLGYVVGAVLFGIIVAVSLLPSKRSHRDF